MANASVEKLKALGLRQGEKLVVGIAATILVVCLGLAASKATIATSPDELQKKAEQADSNLGRKQDQETILTRIEAAGIKDPGFVKTVENQAANALKPGDYKVKLDWVIPEPGAGLIRDTPELIAPTELAVFPGRGGLLLWPVDDKGKRIPDTSGLANNRRNEARGGRRALGGRREKPEDAAKRQEAEKQKRQRLMAGNVDAAKEKDQEKDKAEPAKAEAAAADPADVGPWKEETTGKRWVVITGVVNNEQMNKNWLAALKNPAIAFPQYVRVDAERQVRQSDGTWSEPTDVDEDAKFKVLENLPELDEEFVPIAMRPEALVDPLPFVRAGYWTGVHVARLVPAEVRDGPANDANAGNMRGPGGGGGKMMAMGEGATGGRGNMGAMGEGEMGGSMRGGMGVAGGSQPDEAVVANNEATLMIRSLDFSVEPNTTYRYRLRLVVKNPNFEHSDVNPGVDTSSKELIGPWSEPTEAVSVPADVSAYAQSPAQDNRRDDVVMFQVVRWNPASGQTVLKTDDAAPGFLIGDNGNVQEPSSEGGGPKSVTIDFNSRSIILDSAGGRTRLPDIGGGIERNTFTVPAVAMVVEPDGSVVIRSQAEDRNDEVREDMEANYHQAIKDSGKPRAKGSGTRKPRSGKRSKRTRGRR